MVDTPPSPKTSLPNIGRASAIMVASLFLSRVLGIVREMIISWKFGQDIYTDSYRLAFVVPDLLFYLIAGGALSSAFIPVFSEYFHTDRERDAWKVFSVVATTMTIVVGIFVVLTWIFTDPIAAKVAGEKGPEAAHLIGLMSRVLVPAQFAFLVGGLMVGTLYARQVFTVPGLSPNIYNLGIIVGALVLSSFFSPGVIGMTWGALIGALLGSFVVPFFVMRKLGSHFTPSLDFSHEGVRKVFRLMAPVVFGLSLAGVFPVILRLFGSQYPEQGVNSALENANQLMQAPLGVFGQSLALAAFPALSQFFAQEKMDMFRDQLVQTLRTVLYLSVPVSVLMMVVPGQVIKAVFQYGKFGQVATDRTAACLSMYAIGIAAWCMQPLLMRAFFAVQEAIIPVILGTLTTALFFVLCFGATKSGMTYTALPLACSISAFALVILLSIALNKRLGPLDFAGLGTTLVKSVGSALVAGLILYGGTFLLPHTASVAGRGIHVLITFSMCLLFGWAYFWMTTRLGMPESAVISRALKKLNRKTAA